ncbi:aminopeptidase N [Desulfonema ishimotonii]|uniref:Aminopeptidase N n=1 Tax=Desulfonema ishimotonii TaxID=45657 RepID=A0A401G2I1_9BACT|nr:aminopeptidase N [Desulfonema ishimotonii]GBC63440.1 aminopeptidase N [Desulfonema ishimotonii]
METPQVKYLRDYRPPAYWVDTIDLNVELKETDTLVRSTLTVRRNTDEADETTPLILNGRNMELMSAMLDGNPLSEDQYQTDAEHLTISDVPARFTLETTVKIQPQQNTSLEGLYRSGGMFCTQCEAEGFRNITWFPDRPDVMARYSCTIVADRKKYPILLSNGNLTDSGDMDDGRHWVRWEDPFKKPCYLFALVAGDLFCLEDTFRTQSGRDVALRIFVEHENRDKCDYAMQSLRKSMKWDEEAYGREYDLDIYMIVAVNDFNMGAMENKGLNVFNSKYVLAKPETATDADFWNIERVIAHEYFHNWTGNRITLRNWFQLSLKEGLTVFRDQEFSSDMTSRPVKRIADVRVLRAYQFPEDGGPMAHPVRPASYIKMDNFYTVTVYEKGAEVIRMIHRLLGPEGFRKGTDLYFERHDGQAVSIEEFVGAMADANGADFSQFMRWYSQAGTPEVTVKRAYDAENRTYALTFTQKCPPTPDMADKAPMHIPVALGLLGRDGEDMPLQLRGESEPGPTTRVLELRAAEETFEFVNVPEAPVPSILRGFSAPVRLRAGYTDEEQAFLFACDSDEFNRWDAGQNLFAKVMLRLIRDIRVGTAPDLRPDMIESFRQTLRNTDLDKSFIAQALTLPTESELAILMSESGDIDPDAIHAARHFTVRTLAQALKSDFEQVFDENRDAGPYRVEPEAIGRRSLKNLALGYLGKLETPAVSRFIAAQFQKADNMTDEIAALSVLSHMDCEEREPAIARFYERWQSDVLVLDKWFALQAAARLPGTLDKVKALLEHPDFSIKNPNKVRALIGAFCGMNPWRFHDASGAGYEFLADRVIELNAINPQIASRMVAVLNHWKKYDAGRQALMKTQLERIAATPDLSENVYEIVSKALA